MAVNTKDKYYTPEWLVKHTVKKAVEIIGKENITDIIEPSAGDGAFIEELDKLAKELGVNVGYYDLYPSHPRIIKMDYKKLIKSYKKGRLIIGNPPFGTSSSLWKAFCKKSAKIGDFIAFVSPASQYKSNYYFKEGELIYSELLNDVEYRGDEEYGGKDQKVRTCLNIYKVYDREEEEDWRIKRLEQDVKIIAPFGLEENVKRYIDCDFFIARMHTVGAIYENFDDIPTNVKSSLITVRILNKDVKDKVRSVLQNLKEYYKNEYTAATVSTMSNMFLKEYLIKHLYPTREERLEQDVLITGYDNRYKYNENILSDYDFFNTWFGGYKYDKIKGANGIIVKILNEEKREKITKYFENLHKDEECFYSQRMVLNKVKDKLKQYLYPTREERLEQDIQIVGLDSRDPLMNEKLHNYDWYLDRFKTIGKPSQTPRGDCFAIKILNENVRSKVDKVMNEFDTKYRNDICRLSNGTPVLSIFKLRDILITNLYPTREERLEQDVLIERDNRTKEYDFIIDRRGWNLGKLLDNAEGRSFYGIKVLNDNMRTNIESAIKQLEIDFKIKAENDLRSLSMPEVKQQLIKHLYPTREERLEQDISIELDHSNRIFEYHISQLGDAGRTTKERIAASSYGITILNENLRDKFEQSFDLIKQLIQKHPSLSIASGGSMSINKHAVKEVLMNVLYPQDNPQFEDYDYPEIRKPVHVERAVHGKPLIPIEYREEIVKTPKEETKVAAVALF